MNPLARNTDPETSHLAAASVSVNDMEREVLKWLHVYPGSTTTELGEVMARSCKHLRPRIALEAPHKRMSGLEAKQLAKRGHKKRNPDSGRMAETWWPV